MSTAIIPEYKLLIVYDVLPDHYEVYYQYILREFVPALREMGLYMTYAWHVAYGDYPARQIEFVAENIDIVHAALGSMRYQQLEKRLKSYTTHYNRKLVHFEDRFQF